jgi:hypothetical protein
VQTGELSRHTHHMPGSWASWLSLNMRRECELSLVVLPPWNALCQ